MPQKLLLIDGVAANRIVTKVKLAAAHYEVLSATSAEEGLQIARTERPQLVISESNLSGTTPDELCCQIRELNGMADAGIILLSADEDSFCREDALAAGADEILVRPFDDRTLMTLIRSLLRRQHSANDLAHPAERLGMVPDAPGAFSISEMAKLDGGSGLIAVVSVDSTRATQIKALLSGQIRDRLVVLPFDNAFQLLESNGAPDLLLLDVGTMEARAAVSCIAEFRHRCVAQNTSIIVVTAHNDPETAAVARDLGVCEALSFGISADELTARVRTQLKRKRANDLKRDRIDEGLRLAAIDPLTGALNRRAGLLSLEQLIRVARNEAKPLALLAMDIDAFKSVNDRFGHGGGDTVLQAFSERISATLRANDLFARIGGDEFIIALPGAQEATSHLVAERIRKLINGVIFEPISGKSIHCTVSIGLAMADPQDKLDAEALIALADQALYRAKSAGRDSVKGRSAA